MIYDSIKNLKLYTALGKRFKEAEEFIAGKHFKKTAGRYELKNGMYYMVQDYETKPDAEGFFESHKKFIDLQYIVKGKERHEVANSSTLKVRNRYDAEKDLVVYDGSGFGVILDKGYFVIYFPEDAHMPNMRVDKKPEKMLKVVFKIPVA